MSRGAGMQKLCVISVSTRDIYVSAGDKHGICLSDSGLNIQS